MKIFWNFEFWTYISCRHLFSKFNEICLSLQKKETNIFRAQDNISFSRKLQYWSSQVDVHNFDCFPSLTEYQLESEIDLPAETVLDIKDHLRSLSISLNEYFPDLEIKDRYWVQNPFRVTENLRVFMFRHTRSWLKWLRILK